MRGRVCGIADSTGWKSESPALRGATPEIDDERRDEVPVQS